MEFIARIHYNDRSRTAMANLANRNLNSGKQLGHRVICLLIGLTGIVFGVYLQRSNTASSMSVQLCLAYGTLFLGMGFLWRPIMSKANHLSAPKREGSSEFYFDDHGFSVTNLENYQSSQYPYEDLTRFTQVDGYYALFLGEKAVFLVDQSQFVSGDIEAFCGYIESKTGLLLGS